MKAGEMEKNKKKEIIGTQRWGTHIKRRGKKERRWTDRSSREKDRSVLKLKAQWHLNALSFVYMPSPRSETCMCCHAGARGERTSGE